MEDNKVKYDFRIKTELVPGFSELIGQYLDGAHLFVNESDDTKMSKLDESFLSIKEIERAKKFMVDSVRKVYLKSHAVLNRHITQLLNSDFNNLVIDYFSGQKPYVKGYDLDFNLSHSGNYFAYIIAKKSELSVGIDIEIFKPIKDIESIANSFYSKEEYKYIFGDNGAQQLQHQRFLEIWTRKEAFLKCIGLGITVELQQINLIPGTNNFQLNIQDKYTVMHSEFIIFTLVTQDFVLSVCVNKV